MEGNETDNEQFPSIDEADLDLCRALWVSVALQAVVDARSNSKKRELQRDKEAAVNWLEAEEDLESDFALVCDLAGIDFKKAQARLLQIVDNPTETADFRCIKKALTNNKGYELRSKYLGRIRRQEKQRLKKRLEITESQFSPPILR